MGESCGGADHVLGGDEAAYTKKDQTTTVSDDDTLLRVLRLLDLHQRGILPAIVTHGAREEQALPRFSREDQDAVFSLLDLPEDREERAAAVRATGPERALSLVQGVLLQPKVPAPGYSYNVHAYQEQHADGVTWLLEEVQIWLTAVKVATSMWTAWPPDTAIPRRGPPPAMRWLGFLEVRDDVGTQYTESEGGIAVPAQPALVSTSGRTTMPRVVESIRLISPGPPPEARELVLRLNPKVSIAEPTAASPPWPEREVQLPEQTYVLHLEHRQEDLRLNKKFEPRHRYGWRVRL